jgi:hypothetical protein
MTVEPGIVRRRARRRQPNVQASSTVKEGKRIEESIWEIAVRSVGGFVLSLSSFLLCALFVV